LLTIAKGFPRKDSPRGVLAQNRKRERDSLANKIVATIHSTAGPSPFLHAAHAIHGDQGMMQNRAPVAPVSNSRNTPSHCPILKRQDSQVVALSKDRSSFGIYHCQGRMPSIAFSIKKIVSNNQQRGFIAYVAREDNEFIQPAPRDDDKNPSFCLSKSFGG